MEITGDPLASPTPEEGRAWLEAHRASAAEACVLIAKKHGSAPLVSFVEAPEEAKRNGRWDDTEEATRNR